MLSAGVLEEGCTGRVLECIYEVGGYELGV